jgi:fructose-specific phosphotransferase system IIC component
MKDVFLLVSGFVGGLFLGYLAAIFAFFVWQLIKEGLDEPKRMAIPAIFLLSIFGTALFYLTGLVFQSWPVFIGAAITFSHGCRPLFKKEEENDQASKP